jgi:hypothetical protein
MTKHALLSPSSAHRWARCPGSVVLTKDLPRTSSSFADEGTAAHELAALCLTKGTDADEHIHLKIKVDSNEFIVDTDMASFVQNYINLVRSITGETMVEQRLSISSITGEVDATGTSDVVLIDGGNLTIIDLKYGRGVRVDAEDNEQLAIYAMSAVEQFDILGEIDQVRMVISQPRLDHVSEWAISLDDLHQYITKIRVAAGFVRGSLAYAEKNNGEVRLLDLNHGDKQCRFCDAKASCPALTAHVLSTVADEFVDLSAPIAPQIAHAKDMTIDNPTLGNLLGAVDLIESWCKAIRAKTESELFAGNAVPGYKLVQGRRGSRKWADADEVETMMKSMRMKLEEMYDFSLISPTTAEKLSKAGVIGPRQWPKLQQQITQPDGKPSVAPMSDKRPALVITATADDFEDESCVDRLLMDLV